MNNQDWFYARLCLNHSDPHPDELARLAEKATFQGLIEQGYLVVTDDFDILSYRWAAVKNGVTVEIINSPKDSGYELSVIPKEAGSGILNWILQNTAFISEGESELARVKFLNSNEDTICFRADINKVLHALCGNGYQLHPHNRFSLPDKHLSLVLLTRGQENGEQIMLAFEPKLPTKGYSTIRGQKQRIWLYVPFKNKILQIAALIHNSI